MIYELTTHSKSSVAIVIKIEMWVGELKTSGGYVGNHEFAVA